MHFQKSMDKNNIHFLHIICLFILAWQLYSEKAYCYYPSGSGKSNIDRGKVKSLEECGKSCGEDVVLIEYGRYPSVGGGHHCSCQSNSVNSGLCVRKYSAFRLNDLYERVPGNHFQTNEGLGKCNRHLLI